MRLSAWGEGVLDKQGVEFPKLEIKRGEGSSLDSFETEDTTRMEQEA